MSADMRAKTIVTVRNEEVSVVIEAPGHFDELVTMQSGSEVILRFLYETHPSLAQGAIPLDIQNYIIRMRDELRREIRECNTASASEYAEDSSRV